MYWTSEFSAHSTPTCSCNHTTEDIKNEKTLTTHTQIKRFSINCVLNCYFAFQVVLGVALIENCFWNAIMTIAFQYFHTSDTKYYLYSNLFLFMMASESRLNSLILSAWNIIHKRGFRQRVRCSGDSSLLIMDRKSTEREWASVFMLQSLVIWSPNSRIVCTAA